MAVKGALVEIGVTALGGRWFPVLRLRFLP
jgi:hypothetical protein